MFENGQIVVLEEEEKAPKTNGKRGRPPKATRWDSQEKVVVAKSNNGSQTDPPNTLPFDWKVSYSIK